MKILVTGCAGFIGSHVCENLLKTTNHIIYGFDNLDPYYDVKLKRKNVDILLNYSNFKFIEEDIVDTTLINEIIFDKIIHLASMAGVRYSIENPQKYIDVNVKGFINILEQCVKTNNPHIVYASSSSVYGMNKKIPFSEEDKIESCNSPYACSKLMMEVLAKTYNQIYGITSIGLRFFTVYGPRGRPDMAPRKFLDAISSGKPINKYGDGNSYRDYTYIDDIVKGIISAMMNEKKCNCEIINLGNNNPITLNNFIEMCEKVTGKTAIINYMGDQKGDVPFTHADISKAIKLLNYKPKILIEDGLTKTHI
jgi:UDP-glucuronate 4-epimerase